MNVCLVGELVRSVYLVVSGEFILDTGDVVRDGKLEPFRYPLVENCYHLSSGSILGAVDDYMYVCMFVLCMYVCMYECKKVGIYVYRNE